MVETYFKLISALFDFFSIKISALSFIFWPIFSVFKQIFHCFFRAFLIFFLGGGKEG